MLKRCDLGLPDSWSWARLMPAGISLTCKLSVLDRRPFVAIQGPLNGFQATRDSTSGLERNAEKSPVAVQAFQGLWPLQPRLRDKKTFEARGRRSSYLLMLG